ncbi:MAG: DM13 domain-containing protein [Flammeovirgaceae bacterium]
MKKCVTLFILCCITFSTAIAQTSIGTRTAPLIPGGYAITGEATLEAFDDGSLTLSLSSDFDTPSGPDVRIYLSNTVSITGAIQIVNLTAINHFSGARTFNLPSNVGINDYKYIVFYCLQFNQLWASGDFGEPLAMDFMCEASTTAGSNGVSAVDICPNDGSANFILFTNSINAEVGEHYAYLITDKDEILERVVMASSFDFEGSTTDEQRVYGIHYDGDLNPMVGQHRMQTTASGCYEHSSGTTFLQITKNNCSPMFDCLESVTATTNWVTEVDICPTDGADDFIELLNNAGELPSDGHYAYLLTDSNEVLLEVITDTVYNFEGSGDGTNRVYGISYDGDLNALIGENRMQTTASGCYTHSGENTFLTITKTACFECVESLTATHAWVTQVDICATDGMADHVFLQNNISTPPGDHYVFLLTDEHEVLQEIIMDTTYNFEGTGTAEQRVYGMSYSGQIDAKIGENRKNTTASMCYEHSGDNLFITINKTAACVTSLETDKFGAQIKVFPNPAATQFTLEITGTFSPKAMQIINVLGSVVKSGKTQPATQLQIDVSDLEIGSYLLRLSDGEQWVSRRIQVVR